MHIIPWNSSSPEKRFLGEILLSVDGCGSVTEMLVDSCVLGGMRDGSGGGD